MREDARALEREGHEVRVVAPSPGGAFGWPGVAARVRERPARALEAARWVVATAIEARGWRCDRVVAHWAIPCALPIATRARADLAIVSHGGDVRLVDAMPAALRGRVVAKLAARASQWRFVSESLLRDLIAGVDARVAAAVERIAIVAPSAIALPDTATVRATGFARRAAFAGDAPLAVSVGRLVASKRVDRAVDFAAVHRMRLVVVGDGPERERLESHARARAVDARFLGVVARDEALAWIAAADVVVHASRAEGLSTVLREADALGTRVVTVDDDSCIAPIESTAIATPAGR